MVDHFSISSGDMANSSRSPGLAMYRALLELLEILEVSFLIPFLSQYVVTVNIVCLVFLLSFLEWVIVFSLFGGFYLHMLEGIFLLSLLSSAPCHCLWTCIDMDGSPSPFLCACGQLFHACPWLFSHDYLIFLWGSAKYPGQYLSGNQPTGNIRKRMLYCKPFHSFQKK